MIRSKEATGKTVEEARAAACAALGVNEDDLNVSYEVLEMPQSTGFLGLKKIPARVRVMVEEEDPAPVEKPVVKASVKVEKPEQAQPAESAESAEPAEAAQPAAQQAQPAPKPPKKAEAPKEEQPKAEPKAAPAAAVTAVAAPVDETPVPIDIESNPKVKAAVDYLKEIVALMGVDNVTFSALQKGEATIIRLDGDKMGALIGRRGETMESLSYLASLVANRLEGDYIKLGLDVAGYRGKRENDLTALAQKIGQKVRRSGRCFSMEPMNPYERRIIHSAISQMEGVRSESKGEGKDRHVIIYSTAPNAQNETYERRGRGRGDRRPGADRSNRGPRSERGERSERGNRGSRPRPNNNSRPPRSSNVPDRSYTAIDAAEAAPVAPKRTQRVDDFADLDFGKIEL